MQLWILPGYAGEQKTESIAEKNHDLGGIMKRREWVSLIILALVAVPALLVAIGQIYVTGVDGIRLRRPETIDLLTEITVLFFLYLSVIRKIELNRIRMGAVLLITAGFLWLHRAFTAMLLSGTYVLVLLMLGARLRRGLDRKRVWKEYHGITGFADFLLGSGCMILIFCMGSLFFGCGIRSFRILTVIIAGFLVGFRYMELRTAGDAGKPWKRIPERTKISPEMSVCIALMLAMILLQVGRMNICADYDSLHYGLRNEYVLDNGGGIYENLGMVNVVYTYSKGLETLLLPISGLPSYGFFLSFQIWMTIGVLIASGQIVELFVGRRYAVGCMALLSCIPGIMNMSITAKTDSMTVFMQLVMLLFLLLYIRRQRSDYLILAVDAYLMTLVLKPTALVFSTAAAGTVGLYILFTKQLKFKIRGSFLPSLGFMVPMWLLIWYRTWLHTGLPLTSVFNSIWAALGFTVRYPYRFESLPSNGGSLISVAGLKHILKRIYGVLMAPVGEDMAHVRIAWGTPMLLIFLLLVCLPILADVKRSRRKEKNTLICLALVFVTNGLMSLVALYLLWQVDGNYFLLLYALSAILAIIVVGKLKSGFLRMMICRMLVPFLVFNVTVTAVSNWGGTLGLTPVKFIHRGYYDHMEESKELLVSYGNEKIWDVLEKNPRNRVVVFGEQPEMLRFPCCTQSYTDIEGSGGNFNLSSSPEALADFFTFAEVDYIYLGSGYLKPGTDGFRNVTGLLKQGYLTDLLYENGNGLAVFSSEPKNLTEEEREALLAEFTEKYWPGEQQ